MKEGLNEVTLLGNLGNEPDFHYGQNGKAVANLRIATVETLLIDGSKTKKSTQWHNVVAFDRIAEACNFYLKKWSRVKVHGRLHSRRLTYKSGRFCVVTTVIAKEIKFLDENDSVIPNLTCKNVSERIYE